MAEAREKNHHPERDTGGRGAAAPSSTTARLADLLLRTARRLRRAEANELSALGLTHGQARALRVLNRRGGPMRISELAERLEIVPRSATTVVDMLEQAGLVERQKDPDDRRAVLAALTAAGHELLGRMRQERRVAAAALFGRVSETQQQELLQLLEALQGEGAVSGPGTVVGGAGKAAGGAGAAAGTRAGRGGTGEGVGA